MVELTLESPPHAVLFATREYSDITTTTTIIMMKIPVRIRIVKICLIVIISE